MKIKNAARYADVSVRTLHTWLKHDNLKYSKVRGMILIKMTDMDSFIESHIECNIGDIEKIVDESVKGIINE